MLKDSIRYIIANEATMERGIEVLMQELQHLSETEEIETTFIIFSDSFTDFEDYLNLVAVAEATVSGKKWKGVFQIAGFHPDYCFTDVAAEDPANYTNRSLYAMLHILREDSITKSVENLPDPDIIPERNVAFSRSKGLEYMQLLRSSCFEV